MFALILHIICSITVTCAIHSPQELQRGRKERGRLTLRVLEGPGGKLILCFFCFFRRIGEKNRTSNYCTEEKHTDVI